MYLAAGAFLAGLALLTIPWWLHRLNAHAAEQRTFSSLFLMRPSEAPVNMRKQLQHIVLLILRWLLLIAACLAFAQPVLIREGSSAARKEPDAHRLIVLDSSLSMAAEHDGDRAFEIARNDARTLIGRLPTGVKAAVISAADRLELVAPLTEDRSRLTTAVANLEPSAARLNFEGLMSRITTLGETLAAPGERLEVHLFSDFQDSGMPDQFNALIAGSIWPVVLHSALDADAVRPNFAISNLRPAADDHLEVTVQSLNAAAREVRVSLEQNDETVATETLFVTENGSATARFSLPADENLDQRRRRTLTWTARLETTDALAADNFRRLVKADAETTELPVITDNDRSYAYLRAAVQAAAPRFIPRRVKDSSDLAAPVVAVLDPGFLPGGMDRILGRYLESGGAVLMTAGSTTRATGQIPLVAVPLAADRFEQTPRGVMALDRSHPVLTGFGGWQDLTFFQAVRSAAETDPGEVILALDDGTPLLTEYRSGTGRLLLLGTALDPAWSTLVVRPVFVGFIANLLGYLAEDLLPAAALVGQPFAIPAQSVQLFNEGGDRVLSLADTVGRPTVSLDTPGIYQLRTPASTRLLAVNVDLAESDLTAAPAELLARWENSSERVAANSAPTATAAPAATGTEATYEVPLGVWFLALLALLVFVETLLANLGSDQNRAREPAAEQG